MQAKYQEHNMRAYEELQKKDYKNYIEEAKNFKCNECGGKIDSVTLTLFEHQSTVMLCEKCNRASYI